MTKQLFFVLGLSMILFSCAKVPPGHKGVEVSWGGETNMIKVYPEGMNGGFHWVFDDLIAYDCREQTLVQKFEFNDVDNMLTPIEISVDFHINPEKPHYLHTKISDYETKLVKTIKSAAKEVVPSYGAVDLNLNKREEAERRLTAVLKEELPEFYLILDRVQITDVDLPQAVSAVAAQTAEQKEQNKLALQKKIHAENTGQAIVATAEAAATAAKFEAERMKALSSPALLKFKQLEVDMEWAKKGVSPYGSNNVFGGNPSLLLQRK
jgi:regulator of protease activity HflC (stomatin/prohibitin superfamily)